MGNNKPAIKWELLPPRARYAAMSRNGCWFWFEEKPDAVKYLHLGTWCPDRKGRYGSIDYGSPTFTDDWRESLCERGRDGA